jgi:hypothetical protein
MKIFLYRIGITTCFFIFSISTSSIARTDLENLAGSLLNFGINSLLNPIPSVPYPKYDGRAYTTNVSPLLYRYIIFERNIIYEDLRVLEYLFSQKGYYVLGQNYSYKQKGTLLVECRVVRNFESKYSSNTKEIYKYSAKCDLLDVNRNNFIVYSGYGEVYGTDKDTKRQQALSLAFYNLNSSNQLHPISFDVIGVDDGIRTSIQKDRDEAILDAKYQALAKTGSEISSFERYRLELAEGKISENSYRQEIEEKSTAIFLPDYRIEELGYIDGAYKVRFTGSIAPDPIGSIETTLQPALQNQFSTYKMPDSANYSQYINTALELIPSGEISQWEENGRQYKMQIVKTFHNMPCRRYILQINGKQNLYTACRDQYGVWRNK